MFLKESIELFIELFLFIHSCIFENCLLLSVCITILKLQSSFYFIAFTFFFSPISFAVAVIHMQKQGVKRHYLFSRQYSLLDCLAFVCCMVRCGQLLCNIFTKTQQVCVQNKLCLYLSGTEYIAADLAHPACTQREDYCLMAV